MITLSQVSKIYQSHQVPALSDITFEISEGQIVYLLGESGSGKSTLLKIVAGLEDKDRGLILVDGKEVTGPSKNLVPGHDSIAYVSQDFKLQQFWTVYDNIGKKISHYTKAHKEERIMELLALCKLESHAARFPKELSGGQQQRIAIAAAIANEPIVVLFDEPFSNLDLPMKAEVRKEMVDMLRALGITVLLVSHDPAEAMAAADSIVILQNGRLEQAGPPEQLYRHPNSSYAAKFLGPINELLIDQKNILSRPESLRLIDSGTYHGHVTSCVFMGMHYHVHISSLIGADPLLAYSDHSIEEGQAINFNIDKL